MPPATVVDEKERFRLLAAEQLPRLYSLARRLVGDEAEDAVQDALLKAYRRLHQLADPDAAPGWLVAIVVNCCRDRMRSSRDARGRDGGHFPFPTRVSTTSSRTA